MNRLWVEAIGETARSKARLRAHRAVVTLAVALVFGVLQTTAQAGVPMAATQAPGFYRTMVGSFEVTSLSDGTVALPVDQLLQAPVEHVAALLAKSYLQSPLELSVNAFLINTGKKLILIDTGAGQLFGPTLGQLSKNLRQSGYRPEQVDDIYLTHLHPDHVGGLIRNGVAVFPNAIVHADRKDGDFWLSADQLRVAKDADKPFFRGAMSAINPYLRAHHFLAFDGALELEAGLSSIATPGHTAGHTSYVVRSLGQTLLICGDLVHVADVQLPEPGIAISFDADAQLAISTRRTMLQVAAKQGYWIAAAHLPFPGLGHLRDEGEGYRFVPINYQTHH